MRTPAKTLEMDTDILDALSSHEVGFHVIPLPKQAADKPDKSYRYEPYNSGKGKSKGKGRKGKAKVQR